MASDHKLKEAIQELYESSAVRDDLNDDEAQRLLQWGEQQIRACAATTHDEDFDQQCRYVRQLMKGINRFVGQREFMDAPYEQEQLGNVTKWLPHVGMVPISEAQIAQNLPPDKSDMGANLTAILNTLTPTQAQAAPTPASAPTEHSPFPPTEPTAHQPFPPADYQPELPNDLTNPPVYPSEQPTDDATDRSQPADPTEYPGYDPDA